MGRRNPCSGCWYYRGTNRHNRTCDYLLITGRRRPCPSGAGCTVRVFRKVVQPQEEMQGGKACDM